MKRLIQHPASWYALFAGLFMIVLACSPQAPAYPDAIGDLPKVEPINHKAYTETILKSGLKFDMVPIPGGSYLMGSPDNDQGRGKDEGPQHPVTIRPLWMGKLEVTWDEYDFWRDDQSATIGA